MFKKGGGTQSHQDDFDLFTSNRKASLSTSNELTSPLGATATNKTDDPFGDFFGGSVAASKPTSTNPWNDSSAKDPFAAEFDLKSSASNNKQQVNPTRKTPESFLGENSSLVNLENLIPSQTRPKSTNPFGGAVGATTTSISNGNNPIGSTMTTSTSHGQLNNPFAAQQAQQAMNRPTINQLQQQSMFPSFGQTTTPTLLQPSLTGGGLGKFQSFFSPVSSLHRYFSVSYLTNFNL